MTFIQTIKIIVIPSLMLYIFLRMVGLISPLIILLTSVSGIVYISDHIVKSYENERDYYRLKEE